MDTFRIGIAGTGKIVPESVAAMRETGWEPVAVWGPHPEKAALTAQQLDIPAVCGNFDELLRAGVDFIYVALVNSAHFDYALRALEAGVNVLVEKPFCSNAAQAERLRDTALHKGLYLFETISNRYLPSWEAARGLLPEIGPVKLFQADFSQYSSRYDSYLRGETPASSFNPATEGGSLRDLNIYNLHLAVDLLGCPDAADIRVNRGYNGVDTSSAILLSYPGALAVCTAAKDSGNPSRTVIQGEKGWVELPGMPNLLPRVDVCVRGGRTESLTPNRYGNRLSSAYAFFRHCFQKKDYDAMVRSLDHTLRVMKTLDLVLARLKPGL